MKNLAILGVAAFRVSKRICRNIPRNYYPEQRNVALFCQLIKQNAQFWAKILKNDCEYMNTIYFNCIIKVKIRVIFTVMNTTYFSNSKNQACEFKIQACTGVESVNSAKQVQCSTKWAKKIQGCCQFHYHFF